MSGLKDARSTRTRRARNSDMEDSRGGWAPTATFEVPHGRTPRPSGQVGASHHPPVYAMSLSREGPPGARADRGDPGPATWAGYPPRPTFGQGAVQAHPRPPGSGSALACPLLPFCVRPGPCVRSGPCARSAPCIVLVGGRGKWQDCSGLAMVPNALTDDNRRFSLLAGDRARFRFL